MAIKRYIAVSGNTITNAFKPNLSTRGTGSNMGKSDVLEVFSIYGQASSSDGPSPETSRILLNFPITDISTDRTNGNIPASGNVDFYLRLYNTRHAYSLPEDITLVVKPVSQSWQEGYGMDMETYNDLTRDGIGSNWMNANSQSSGETTWDFPGATYHSSTYSDESVTLSRGDEDVELQITGLIEEWIAGTKNNHGLGVMLTASQEAYFSSFAATVPENPDTQPYSGSVLHNHTGSRRSYYTKKFFNRGTEFFFKRPCVEARWGSATRDDRGNFYASSSIAGREDNLQTLYFYNYVRGRLQNLPGVGTDGGVIFLKLYTSSSGGEQITTSSPYTLRQGTRGMPAALTDDAVGLSYAITGGYVSTGIYSASLAVYTTASTLFDRWFTGSAATEGDYFHTGSITVNTLDSSNIYEDTIYFTDITNLKTTYTRDEEPTFRVFTRKKNFDFNLYTKATSKTQLQIVNDGYYKVFRVIDDLDVIVYGTGSSFVTGSENAGHYTRMSYDVSGSYFDLDVSLLEAGYSYGIKFAYYINGQYLEQSDVFKFRVE